jgi:hypothetical protein
MKRLKIIFSCLILLNVFIGCSTVVYDGANQTTLPQKNYCTILMPPFKNATNDEHAATAMRQMTGTAVLEQGIRLFQTEEVLKQTAADGADGADGRYYAIAEKIGATHLLMGTIHEFRYKTDLDGDPAVGMTLRLVSVSNGETVWQGTSSNTGYAFASLTSAGQKAVRKLVSEIPWMDLNKRFFWLLQVVV